MRITSPANYYERMVLVGYSGGIHGYIILRGVMKKIAMMVVVFVLIFFVL